MKSGKLLRTGMVVITFLLITSAGIVTWDHFYYPLPSFSNPLFSKPKPKPTWAPGIPPGLYIPPAPQKGKFEVWAIDLQSKLREYKLTRRELRRLRTIKLSGTTWIFKTNNWYTGHSGELKRNTIGKIQFQRDGKLTIMGEPILLSVENQQLNRYKRTGPAELVLYSPTHELRLDLSTHSQTPAKFEASKKEDRFHVLFSQDGF